MDQVGTLIPDFKWKLFPTEYIIGYNFASLLHVEVYPILIAM